GKGLPSWDELRSLKDSPQNRKILEHPSWQGWLERLFALILWSEDQKRANEIAKWLADREASPLTAELALVTATTLEKQAAVRRRQHRWSVGLGIAVIVVNVLALGLLGSILAFGPANAATIAAGAVLLGFTGVLITSFDNIRKRSFRLLLKADA